MLGPYRKPVGIELLSTRGAATWLYPDDDVDARARGVLQRGLHPRVDLGKIGLGHGRRCRTRHQHQREKHQRDGAKATAHSPYPNRGHKLIYWLEFSYGCVRYR